MKATIKTTRRLSCLDKKRYLCKCCNRKRLKTFPLMPGDNKKNGGAEMCPWQTTTIT